MTAFIDLQGFRGDDKNFIPKEVAVISENGYKIAHLLLKPPYQLQSLSRGRRKEVFYMENCFHGLLWRLGQVNFEDFESVLLTLVKDFNTIYVKGTEKKSVLNFLDKSIINLEDLSCPSLDKLKQKFIAVQCLNHTIDDPVCAFENVMLLSRWYKNYEHPRDSSPSENNSESDECSKACMCI